MRHDPRIRQNLDRISTSLESAADNARTGCFTFTKSYLEPCLSSLVNCCSSCLPKPKVTHHHHHHHHHRNRYAGRSEYPFAFYDYDDYGSDDDDGGGRSFLAWGTDELDRLLAGSGSGTPARGGAERMFYGAAGEPSSAGLRRKGTLPGRDSPDPTVIPSTSMFGFLSKFGVRGKGMRYKPSAANLQEHPQRSGRGAGTAGAGAGGPGAGAGGGGAGGGPGPGLGAGPGPGGATGGMAFWGPSAGSGKANGRKRSGTGSSTGSQGDSLRSRGDLWPSEDEDDAVVIGDDAFPRGSDGESSEAVVGLGIGSDDDYRRLAMQRGLSSNSTQEGNARTRTFSHGSSNSAPPTILAASPDRYPTGLGIATSLRPSSVKSREGSIHQQIHRPLLSRARKDKGVETTATATTTTTTTTITTTTTDAAPRPQMRQVPSTTHSPIPPASPSLIDIETTPRMGDNEYDAHDNE